MKKQIWKWSMGLILMTFVMACDDKDIDPVPGNPVGSKVLLEFGEDISFAENTTDNEVLVNFSKAVSLIGNISIEVSDDFSDAYTTDPVLEDGLIKISVNKGDKSFSFKITPVDNTIQDGNKTITLTLTGVSDEFNIGDRKSMVITITDDEMPGEPQLILAGFALPESSMKEDLTEGILVDITFSSAPVNAGVLRLQLSGSPEGLYYTTVPSSNGEGFLKLNVAAGTTQVQVRVIPVNDDMLKPHQVVLFEIVGSEGFIEPGTRDSHALNLLDKELYGKPKSYETSGGGWKAKQTYHYNALGQVSLVEWVNETPNRREGSYTYYYADNGLIYRINESPLRDKYFYQENGRIFKSEVVSQGDVVSYSLYDYDPAGNVGAQAEYTKNPQGEFVNSYFYLYLYYDNGNIYKQLTYVPGEEEGEEVLISTRTFDGYYLDKVNHFPMFEVIPGINAQPNLPTFHRVQENGMDLQYNLSYEFDENGNALSRSVTGSGANEYVSYTYY